MEKKDRDHSLNDIGLKKFAPAIVCFIAVFVLIVLPGDSLPTASEWNWLEISFLDKLVHCFMFALLTFLFLLPVAQSTLFIQQKRFYFIRICIAVCLWGLTTEYIQKFYIPTRDFDLVDWGADCAGVIIAFIYTRRFHKH